MILINSSDFDQTTNDIIDWLNFYNIEFIRLNYSDKVIVRYVEIGEGVSFQFEIFETKKILNSSDISFFWYRRGDIDINIEIECNDESQIKYFNSETDKLKEFIHYFLVNHIPSIGDFYDNDLNKLIVLTEAEKLGLLVPRTLITSYKNNLKNFKNFNGNIIRKGIFNSFELTSEVSDQVIDNSQEHFFYTLFQNNINKFIELRIFFLHKKFWATGIFSQQDEQTKNDFRN
jgi:hypothetical protein